MKKFKGLLKNEAQMPRDQNPQPKLLNRLLSRRSKSDRNELTPPGDMPTFRAKGQLVTAEELRSLGELIRQRYALDLEIWNLRNVRPRDRHLVEDKMKKADAALGKIRRVVQSFDSQDYFTSQSDYAKLQEIKTRIMAEGKRNWMQDPPWGEYN